MPASMRHLYQLVVERQSQSGKASVTACLARWHKDQKFYAVEVMACDKKDRKCKVKFEDDYECWIESSELHLQLSIDGGIKDELIVCCICDDGQSKAPNEIIMCDTCNQGYHLNCHKPKLDREEVKLDDDEDSWCCATCDLLLKMPDSTTEEKLSAKTKPQSPKTESQKSPQRGGIKKSKPMTPKNLNSGTGSQKAKRTPKIKLTKKADLLPVTSTVAECLF